ncbi:TetR/AcrR family transcriptional regulator [Bacillus safensis]|uniref:TetR/AcrR family transcriptional regulator n=1 Tax=Bacillus safensis TaxID=561879 RepID=UPI002076501F|nr:TetR/AcrR family transcriptional regulator [Bacillus safensis]
MTKAGLLYHFPSKEELIQQMNEHVILCFRQQLETYQETSKHEKTPYVRAYILATLHDLDMQHTTQQVCWLPCHIMMRCCNLGVIFMRSSKKNQLRK